MSPELRADFEKQWVALATRLDRFLANRKVSPCHRDDLIQETALRLFAVWPSVDRARSPWPLTATIALNILRDNGRSARNRELSMQLPDTASSCEVEASGLARLELSLVAEALHELPPTQRAALLREVGMGAGSAGSSDAEKMLRLRARKKLRTLVERVSGILVLRPRRDPSDLNAALMAKDGLTQIATCLACAVFGVAAGVVPGLLAPPRAEAASPRRIDLAIHDAPASRTFVAANEIAASSRATLVTRRLEAGSVTPTTSREEVPAAGAPAVPGTTTPLPSDTPLEPPSVEPPPVEPPGVEPPGLPPLPPASPPGDGPTSIPSELVEDAQTSVGTL